MGRKAKGPRTYFRGDACWVQWADGSGGKIRRRLHTPDGIPLSKGDPEEEIRLAAAAEHSQWVRVSSISKKHWQKGAAVTVGDLTVRFAIAFAADWSSRTQNDYGRCMKIIEQYFGTSTPMDDVSVEAAEDFKLWLSSHGKEDGTGLAARSVNNVIDFARSLFRYAQRMGWVSRNVFEFVKPRRAMPVYAPDPFTPEEVEAILSTARSESDLSWFYPIVLCAALTGCRRGPLPQMLVSDYDPERRQLSLRGEIAKQGRPFCYAVPDVLANELAVLVKGREPDDSLFIDRQGKPLNIKAFDTPDRKAKRVPPCRTWYRLLQRAGVRPRGIHNLRRAAVSNLAEADVTMDKIIAVTGQSVEVARNLYLRIDRETQRNTMQKLATLYRQNVDSPPEEPHYQPLDKVEAETFILRVSKEELTVLQTLLQRQSEQDL